MRQLYTIKHWSHILFDCISFYFCLLSMLYVHTIIQKIGLYNKCTLPVRFIANISLLPDFPRLDQWSENTFLSDASLFMDGFLYISSGPAKTTLDRRGKDGERWWETHSISVFVSDLTGVFCQCSSPVKHLSINQCQSVSCQTANR